MKIIHIYHSGFLVKLDNTTLVFDCLDSTASRYFNQKEKIYVFTSHSHSDHYSQKIFDWERKNHNVKYFFWR